MCDFRLQKAVLLVLCVLLGACDRAAQQDDSAGPTRLIPKPCWFETDDSWPITQCFMMEVPENYAKPSERRIQFPVVRFLAAEPDADKYPLLHLGAGGPGASLGLEPENASDWLWINYAAMTVEDGRDLIIMDPRGTGMAQPRLTCHEFIEDAQTAFRRNLSPDEEARVFTFSMERCYSRLSKGADLAQYNSATIARDVEALRQLMDVEKFNLYGVSYASRYALTMARDYPDSVRALVLNSAVFPNIIYTQQLAKDSLAAYQRGLQACSADKLCNSRYPDLRNRLENLVQSLDENPRTISITHRFSDEEYPFVLTGQRLLRVLFQALYNENFYSDLPKVIEALETAETEEQKPVQTAIANFMEIVLDPYFGDAAGVSHFCYEEAPFVDFDRARASAADSGILGGAVRSDIELMQVQCRIWAIPSAPLLESKAIATTLPVMLLHGGLDPVLAADDVDKARRKLPNHQWLLFPALAHDIISASNCAEQAAARFLDNPTEDQTESARACRREELANKIPAGGDAPANSQYSQQD
ncbi:alpha/beta fold hydrolase [Microbulbifer marinus]|uniref:Pimeloyl-ACP methyl ester carboxylesterase n=1 Tax=Microbulbifer marinus TaxID=658218 RepID=A0A1H3WAF3_9GAMM|nr:alpha/beta fold hydrolase [Microbulbifer marinus]SDZ83821.1 Pimeloyl-ACP methyl ester carboxylesterase [Microbulbifer marinus]